MYVENKWFLETRIMQYPAMKIAVLLGACLELFFKTTNVYKYSKCHLYTLGAGADQKRTGSAKPISRNMSNYRIILYRLPPTLLNLFPTVQRT